MANIVVVGVGKVGRRHLSAYLSGVGTVAGIVEPDDAQWAAASCDFASLRRYSSLEDALDDPIVDVLDICTPTPTHFGQVAAALRAGKSVFCEKPLVTTTGEARQLCELLDHQTFRVGYPYRFHPRVARLKQHLDAGALGTPHLAYFRVGGRGSHRAWKHRRDHGGGVVLDMASHMIDLAHWFFGPFRNVDTLYRSLVRPNRDIDGEKVAVDADDVVALRLETVDGVQVFVYADFLTPGFANSIEVSGSNGSALVSVVSGVPDRYVMVDAADGLPAGETLRDGETIDMISAELREFVTAFDRGDVIQDTQSSLAVTRVIELYEQFVG